MADGTTAAAKPRRARKTAPTTSDPVEIAMEAMAKGDEPEGPALRLIERQERLVGWQIASERAGVTLKLLTGAAGAAAAAVLGWMAFEASQARGVVIDGIAAPRSLEERGFTPTALATELQDKLAQMQSETASVRGATSVRSGALSSVKVQIPSTGISVQDLEQVLRQWLGRETHISGELSYVPGGSDAGALALSLRTGERPGRRFVQRDGDLEPLLGQAAEHVHATLDPFRHVNWLSQHGRGEEALRLMRRLTQSESQAERALATAGVVQVLGIAATPDLRRAAFLRAEQIDAAGGQSINAANEEVRMGLWEAAFRRSSALEGQPAPEGSSAFGRGQWPNAVAASHGEVSGDYTGMFRSGCFQYRVRPCTAPNLAEAMELADGLNTQDGQQAVRIGTYAAGAAAMHEPTVAALVLAAPAPDISRRTPAFQAQVESARIRGLSAIAVAREDWPEVLRQADAWDGLAAQWPGLRHGWSPSLQRARALAELGQVAAAERAVGSTPLNCYPCVVLRAVVAERAGRIVVADHWFAEAARIGPSLPMAHLERARVLQRRGDLDAAMAAAQLAIRKGPKLADARAMLGELQMAKGDARGAAASYSDAAKLAPNWGGLRVLWGQALAAEGKASEARAQWQAAAGMDLTAAERARVQVLLAGRRAELKTTLGGSALGG